MNPKITVTTATDKRAATRATLDKITPSLNAAEQARREQLRDRA